MNEPDSRPLKISAVIVGGAILALLTLPCAIAAIVAFGVAAYYPLSTRQPAPPAPAPPLAPQPSPEVKATAEAP